VLRHYSALLCLFQALIGHPKKLKTADVSLSLKKVCIIVCSFHNRELLLKSFQ